MCLSNWIFGLLLGQVGLALKDLLEDSMVWILATNFIFRKWNLDVEWIRFFLSERSQNTWISNRSCQNISKDVLKTTILKVYIIAPGGGRWLKRELQGTNKRFKTLDPERERKRKGYFLQKIKKSGTYNTPTPSHPAMPWAQELEYCPQIEIVGAKTNLSPVKKLFLRRLGETLKIPAKSIIIAPRLNIANKTKQNLTTYSIRISNYDVSFQK